MVARDSGSLYLTLPDGATLAYDIFGSEQLGKGKLPIALLCGRSLIRSDFDSLITPLSKKRLVLVHDYRGFGESTYSTPHQNDDITLELMARDFLVLLTHIGWNNVDMLGYSMGGAVLQELLLLPYHPTNPTPLPFRVHHVLLTSTLCTPLENDVPPPTTLITPGQSLTAEQKKKLFRPFVDANFSPKWLALPENKARYETWLGRVAEDRSIYTIRRQGEALSKIKFRDQLINIPPSIEILVIHGQDDLIVPFSKAGEILHSIPHAHIVEKGSRRGQVPSYDFGHGWFDYFGVDKWIGVIEVFVDGEDNSV